MTKHEKLLRDIKKISPLASVIEANVANVVQQYRLTHEREIEEVLSPFWAWRTLNG
jgi:hypothetical protein